MSYRSMRTSAAWFFALYPLCESSAAVQLVLTVQDLALTRSHIRIVLVLSVCIPQRCNPPSSPPCTCSKA